MKFFGKKLWTKSKAQLIPQKKIIINKSRYGDYVVLSKHFAQDWTGEENPFDAVITALKLLPRYFYDVYIFEYYHTLVIILISMVLFVVVLICYLLIYNNSKRGQ